MAWKDVAKLSGYPEIKCSNMVKLGLIRSTSGKPDIRLYDLTAAGRAYFEVVI